MSAGRSDSDLRAEPCGSATWRAETGVGGATVSNPRRERRFRILGGSPEREEVGRSFTPTRGPVIAMSRSIARGRRGRVELHEGSSLGQAGTAVAQLRREAT